MWWMDQMWGTIFIVWGIVGAIICAIVWDALGREGVRWYWRLLIYGAMIGIVVLSMWRMLGVI